MKVIIVCLEFARMQRARSLAEGLSLAGHEVVYVTAEAGAADPRYATIVVPFQSAGRRVKRAVGLDAKDNIAQFARTRGRFAERIVRTGASFYETFFQHPDRFRGWIGACRRQLGARSAELGNADIVIASFSPATALVVGRALARRLRVPLVLDFRDLWTDNGTYRFLGIRRTIDRWLERRLIRAASALTSAAPDFTATLERRYPGVLATTVYTGVDTAPWQAPEERIPDGTLRFGHFGVWYAGRRTIRPLLKSVRRLTDGARVDPARVEVHMYGYVDETVSRDATETGLAHALHLHGWIPPSDVPAALGTVDVALLLAWPEDVSSVPLKTYHYLAAGKTILLLGARPESEMRRVLEPLPGVDCPDTPEELDACVLRYREMTQARASLSWTLEKRPLPFTRDTMTAEFVEVAERVVSR